MIILVVILVFSSCVTQIHTIGDGPDTGEVIIQRQYYVLGGLIPLSQLDSRPLVGNDRDYRIITEYTAFDFIVSALTGGLIMSRTVQIIR